MNTKHGIVGRTTEGLFRYKAWPSVTRDKDGVLYAVCSGHRRAHVCPFGKNLMFTSHDGGETWSSPIIVNDTYFDDRDAGITAWGDSTLFLTWFSEDARDYRKRPWRCADIDSPLSLAMQEFWKTVPEEEYMEGYWCRISHDNGQTWSEARRTPVTAPHGAIHLKDGRILYVGRHTTYDPALADGSIQAFTSSDEGKTWQHLSEVRFLEEWKGVPVIGPCEPHCVELPNGDILVAIRAINGDSNDFQRITLVRSKDGGKTWEDPQVLDNMIGSPPHFCLRTDGALVLSYGRRIEPFGEYIRISYDNGYTWTEDQMIRSAPDWDLGYPSSVELPDGNMLTVYYQKYEDDPFNSILYTKWDFPKK